MLTLLLWIQLQSSPAHHSDAREAHGLESLDLLLTIPLDIKYNFRAAHCIIKMQKMAAFFMLVSLAVLLQYSLAMSLQYHSGAVQRMSKMQDRLVTSTLLCMRSISLEWPCASS